MTIGSSVTSIEADAFLSCTNLASIAVDTNNPSYWSQAGVLFNKNQSELVAYPSVSGGYSIPNSVTRIGKFAFGGCYLTSVAIPDSVTSIGDFAFSGSALASVVIPSSVTHIGYQGFNSCQSLTNLVIPNTITSLGDYVFFTCTSLHSVTIPDGVTSIGKGEFRDCYSLANVVFPNSLTSIGDTAFQSCALTNVIIPGSVTNIGQGAFYVCYGLSAAFFLGNAPPDFGNAFLDDSLATVYYLPGTAGWGATFGSRPTAQWTLPYPVILGGANGNTNLGVQNGEFGFSVSWATNLSVVVESCNNLANPTWTPVTTNALVNGTNYFSDSQWTNYPSRFYRIRSL
jgi:hypothetical protein